MSNPHLVSGIQYDVVTSPLPDGVVADHDVTILMRDGVRLAASVYRPALTGHYPAILAISPYGKTNFDAISLFSRVPENHIGHIRISDSVSFEAPDPGYWTLHGYVVVQVDVRGQGRSEGDTEPLGPTEQADYEECIAWAARQEWSSGDVALCGVSYLALTQWAVAQHCPPALKAMIPWEGFTDPYLRAYPGGIPEVGMWSFVLNEWILPNHNPASGFVTPPPGMTPPEHPLRDAFWDRQRIAIEQVDIPILVCASFSDQGLHTRESFENFVLAQSTEKWLYNHRQPKWHAFYSEEALSYQRAFLDHFVKGEANGFELTPPVRLEVNQDRRCFKVITASAWPIPETRYVPLYLDAGAAALAEDKPRTATSTDYDPTMGSAQFDFVFVSQIDVVGNAKLKLWVEAIDVDDLDLFVALKKFDTAGNEVLFYGFGGTNPNDVVARGWMRVSHRQLDERQSRPDRPVHTHRVSEKLGPGQIVPVEVEILPSGTTFLSGETLRVHIQGKAIEPDAALLTFVPNDRGRHRIWTGGRYDSHVLLPKLEQVPAA